MKTIHYMIAALCVLLTLGCSMQETELSEADRYHRAVIGDQTFAMTDELTDAPENDVIELGGEHFMLADWADVKSLSAAELKLLRSSLRLEDNTGFFLTYTQPSASYGTGAYFCFYDTDEDVYEKLITPIDTAELPGFYFGIMPKNYTRGLSLLKKIDPLTTPFFDGYAVNVLDQSPIEECLVLLEGDASVENNFFLAVTDANGYFSFPMSEKNGSTAYTLSFAKNGYSFIDSAIELPESWESQLPLHAGENMTFGCPQLEDNQLCVVLSWKSDEDIDLRLEKVVYGENSWDTEVLGAADLFTPENPQHSMSFLHESSGPGYEAVFISSGSADADYRVIVEQMTNTKLKKLSDSHCTLHIFDGTGLLHSVSVTSDSTEKQVDITDGEKTAFEPYYTIF